MDQTTPSSDPAAAASKIQSAYRAHASRGLYEKIAAADSAADELERAIQRQETVDAVRSDARERVRMNEALMALLLNLDAVPGRDPAVRDARRKVSRRIVGLQEILDAVSEADIRDFAAGDWSDFMAEIEEQVCLERGGKELEAFCDQYLGFRCLSRFLSQP